MSIEHKLGWGLIGLSALGAAFTETGFPLGTPGTHNWTDGSTKILDLPPAVPVLASAAGGLFLVTRPEHKGGQHRRRRSTRRYTGRAR